MDLRSLEFINDATPDRSSRMNSGECSSTITSAQIQSNAAMDNELKCSMFKLKGFVRLKKWLVNPIEC